MFKMNYKFKAGGPEYSCNYPNSKDVDNIILVFIFGIIIGFSIGVLILLKKKKKK